jgi:hypothetical protein
MGRPRLTHGRTEKMGSWKHGLEGTKRREHLAILCWVCGRIVKRLMLDGVVHVCCDLRELERGGFVHAAQSSQEP